MMDNETRLMTDFDIEARSSDGALVVSGLAMKYQSETPLYEGHYERFDPGAFGDTVRTGAGRGVFALYQHDWGRVLGNTKSGTMELMDSPSELRFKVTLPQSESGLFESVQRGDVAGASVRFRNAKDKHERRSDRSTLRTVNRATLVEISLTPIPVYDDTYVTAAKRSLEEWLQGEGEGATIREMNQELIRFYLAQAKGLVSE